MKVDPITYLYLVLVPVAESYRQKWKDDSPFTVLRQGGQIRVKFIDDGKDKEWKEFCNECSLEQDTNLDY